MDSSLRHVTERRLARRITAIAELGIRQAKVRPGHEAAVLDISSHGALIETALRLMPGRQIELQIERGGQIMPIRGRVMRSQVARVQPSRISYRGAIGFEQPLVWLGVQAKQDEYAVHGEVAGGRVRS
jgi:PilZ domain-containing protein